MSFILMTLIILAACAVLFTVAPLRKRLLTARILKGFRAALPSMSETERHRFCSAITKHY